MRRVVYVAKNSNLGQAVTDAMKDLLEPFKQKHISQDQENLGLLFTEIVHLAGEQDPKEWEATFLTDRKELFKRFIHVKGELTTTVNPKQSFDRGMDHLKPLHCRLLCALAGKDCTC